MHVHTSLVKQSSYTLLLENLVLLIDLVTSEKERKEISIVVVAAVKLAVHAPLISVTPRLMAATYFKARYHAVFSAEGAAYHSVTQSTQQRGNTGLHSAVIACAAPVPRLSVRDVTI